MVEVKKVYSIYYNVSKFRNKILKQHPVGVFLPELTPYSSPLLYGELFIYRQ